MATFNYSVGGDDLISPFGGNSEVFATLYRDGIATPAGAFLDGVYVKPAPLGSGDSNTNQDTIILNHVINTQPGGVEFRAAVIWDEQTMTSGFQNLWNANRYGLPSGAGITQLEAWDIIQGSSGADLVKLDYNPANGGQAYTWNITVYGGGGRDIIVSGEGNDALFGGDESSDLGDGVWGQGGNDTIFGGVNSSGGDNDDLYGGSGADTIYGSSSAVIGLNTISDEIWGDEGNDVLYGGSFVSGTMQAGSGTDTFYGGLGDDTMMGGDNGDRFFGGNGTDPFASQPNVADTSLNDTVSYQFATSGVRANLQLGTGDLGEASGDTFAQIEHLTGSNFADTLTGSSTTVGTGFNATIQSIDNRLMGLDGNDSLSGGAGNDTLFGGNDLDFLDGGDGTDRVFGEAGNDSINGAIGNDTVYGGDGSDSLSGNADTDTVFGDGGDDTISGSSGVGGDTLYGGSGTEVTGDWLTYATSPAVTGSPTIGVTANLGTNVASGAGTHAENDRIFEFENLEGSAFNDFLTGSAGVNSIRGGLGNDTIQGGAGADSMDGGDGSDFLSYSNYNVVTGVSITLNNGTGSMGDAQGDTFINFENLIGSQGNDRLTGNIGANTIYGGSGVDTVDGLTGGDVMVGGVDAISGGQGDFLLYLNSVSGVQVNLGTGTTGNGTSHGGDGDDVFFGFQHVFGSNSADILTGNDLSNSLMGATGADTLYGGVGGDFLFGENDGDTIYGGQGADSLFGGAGADTLRGEDGLDTLDGGSENDVLIVNGDNNIIPVGGWDGEAGSAAIGTTFGISRGYGDTAFGGSGIDTVNLSETSNASARTIFQFNNWNTLSPVGMAGIEIIIAGSAADLINLTFNDGVTRSAYGENVTVFAGENTDVVFSGSGNDLIVGGRQVGNLLATDAADTLFGGQGNDTIFGDDLTGGDGGGDTLYGGGGMDTLSGGGGDDFLFDLSGGGNLLGGDGSDLLVLNVVGVSGGTYGLTGGKDDPTGDGNDRVFTAGTYGTVDASLGGNADIFISSSVNSGSAQVDRVFGQTGDDAISSWHGNDILDGGGGSDVIWGGAGADTIYGGDDSDYLYGGAGDGDLLVGGGGADYYYWARNDGDDTIEDRDNDTINGDEGTNYILVFSGFEDPTNPNDDLNGDAFIDGAGVVEVDGNLYDNDGNDMVQLTVDVNDNTIYHLEVLNGVGAGSTLTFDRDEISIIALGNSDNGTMTLYQWVDDDLNPLGGSYRLV
jgi:Ca2+-binding RTX toxin-like protein